MVDGTTIKDFRFFDDETGKIASVAITIEKGIELKLLEKINQNLSRLVSK